MDSNSFSKFYLIYWRDVNSGLRSVKEAQDFWWSRIPNDTRGILSDSGKSDWIALTSHS